MTERRYPIILDSATRIELFKGEGGWRIRMKASNGETLAESPGYIFKRNLRRAARRDFPHLPVVEV